MQELIRYKIGYEISWAVLRRVQGQTVDPSKEIYISVEIVPNWVTTIHVNPLLIEEIVRLNDGRKAFLLRPDHHKVTSLAEALLLEEEKYHAVEQWIEGLPHDQMKELQEGLAFYNATSR